MKMETAVEKRSEWGKFLKRHWGAFALFVVAATLAVAFAIYVFVWFTGTAQSMGVVPAVLGAWSMSSVVLFILHAVFWELVLIGIPVAIGAAIAWQWWKRLPEEEKQSYHLVGRSSKSRGAGGAIGPLLFIAFALKVYVDGNWSQAISTYTLDYVVGSMVTILIWVAAIFAIPSAVGIAWWIFHEMNKQSQAKT